MKKSDELEVTYSCWNKAEANERMFILLARDVAAPEVIRFWCQERIRLGKNVPGDRQIVEALTAADLMDKEGPHHRKT